MKNESTRKVINVDKPNYVPLFEFKELDNAVIRLSLFKASVEFDITGQTVKLGAKTSKGLKEQSEGFTINKNNLDIDLKNSILVPGTVEIDLELKDASGTMTTASFFITVKSKVLNDKAVEGTNEFDTFTKTAAKIEEDYKGLRRIIIDENQAANLQDQVNQTNAQLETKTSEKSGLSGWLRSFEFDRNKKICFIGDSTTDGPAGAAQFLYECFNRYHLNSGDNLEGVTIVDKGSSGNTCYNFINNIPTEKGIDACISEQADLYVFCYGINDVRLGATTKEQLKSYISTAVERLLTETNAYILLRVPNSLLKDDPTNANYIQPLSNSQLYTDIMWEAYMELKHKWERVDVIDIQTLIFGRTVLNKVDNPYMGDSLHPNKEGFYRIARCIADYIGITPKLRTDLREIAKLNNKPYTLYPKILETKDYEMICEGYFVDMGSN